MEDSESMLEKLHEVARLLNGLLNSLKSNN